MEVTSHFPAAAPLAKMLVGLLPMKQGVREGRNAFGTVLYVGCILLDNLKRTLIPSEPTGHVRSLSICQGLGVGKPILKWPLCYDLEIQNWKFISFLLDTFTSQDANSIEYKYYI